MCTIVYKLGGSLLDLPDLSERLHALLNQPVPLFATRVAEKNKRLVVVGGGPLADVVRRWDRAHGLGDELAHRLGMQSMSFNAQLVAAILRDAQLVTSRSEASDVWSKGRVAVLAAAEFVEAEERRSHDFLPRSWNVTSDSVAAYVAHHWPADGLVLLKSVSVPSECDANSASNRGLVDAHFPLLVGRIPIVSWTNLRSEKPTIEHWLESPIGAAGKTT
jgi:5-(aminomethyl)-3-furanmethanol phosphate kinase